MLAQWLSQRQTKEMNGRAALRRIKQWGWLPPAPVPSTHFEKSIIPIVQAGTHSVPKQKLFLLWARTPRGEWLWLSLKSPPVDQDYCNFGDRLLSHFPKGFQLLLVYAGSKYAPLFQKWLTKNHNVVVPVTPGSSNNQEETAMISSTPTRKKNNSDKVWLTDLQRLEAESIHIMREVVATCDNPVMLYSIGKDSAVMLHLALKAFYPAKLPFPLLHIDTGWKFKDMYEFRERMQAEHDFKLLIHQNPEGLKLGINPFTHGSQIHTDVMKTQALKQALDYFQFDAACGGARRDE
jgi:sulfate adenylyltransferase subunit 2